MSKKVNEIKTAITASELEALFTEFKNVSLRKFAGALEVSYPVILKASKAPVAGEAYNPDITNYAAIATELNKREKDLTTLDWLVMNTATATGATLIKDAEAFQVGMKVYLRRDNTKPYEIVYKTESHIVLLLEGSTEPHAWAISTFLINGPVFEPRATRKVAEVAEAPAQAE
jgi:hypothetical protein